MKSAHINVNSISGPRSPRLITIESMTSALAGKIVQERDMNGDFSSFDDLRQRVHGIGAVRVERLQAEGFVVVPRQSAKLASKHHTQYSDSDEIEQAAESTSKRKGSSKIHKDETNAKTKQRHININAIGRASSGRLASVLSPDIADEIIRVRLLGGNFESFEDMRLRVHGLGPAKIKKLQDSGFVVENSIHFGDQDDDDLVTDKIKSLRDNVKSMTEQTWRHRDFFDLYTKTRKTDVQKHSPEVDHVWECQIIDSVNARVVGDLPAFRTRGAQTALRSLFNGVENLNVTTHAVNQAKKGPFSRWLHKYDEGSKGKSVEEHARESCPELVDSGVWSNISQSAVKVWDELDAVKGDIRDHRQLQLTSTILDELNTLMCDMHIQ